MTNSAKHDGLIILGTPRSGTTLLRRLLDAHPNICCPGETNLLNGCGRLLAAEQIAEGVDIGVLSGLSFLGFDEEQVLERLREFVFSFHRDHAAKVGKTRWAEKTAFDSFYIDSIDRLCGDHAYFICLHRHGMDVACSLQELCETNGRYLGELHDYIKRYPRPLEAFAHVWVDLTASINAFVTRRPENTIVLRYEDLVAEPESNLRRVIEFVGEEWDPSLIERAMQSQQNIGLGDWKTYATRQIERGSIGRWKQLSRHTAGLLAEIVNSTLVECGYEAAPTLRARDLAEARRRYELGMLAGAMTKKVRR